MIVLFSAYTGVGLRAGAACGTTCLHPLLARITSTAASTVDWVSDSKFVFFWYVSAFIFNYFRHCVLQPLFLEIYIFQHHHTDQNALF